MREDKMWVLDPGSQIIGLMILGPAFTFFSASYIVGRLVCGLARLTKQRKRKSPQSKRALRLAHRAQFQHRNFGRATIAYRHDDRS
jgi:hypothetical protein